MGGGRGSIPGCTLTAEALPAGADVAAGHVLAGATVHAGIGLTLVIVNVAVCPAPAWVTVTPVALGKNWGIKHRIWSNLTLPAPPAIIYAAKPKFLIAFLQGNIPWD